MNEGGCPIAPEQMKMDADGGHSMHSGEID